MFFFFFLMIRRPPRSTLSLHDALPIFITLLGDGVLAGSEATTLVEFAQGFERVRNKMALVDHGIVIEAQAGSVRSEEHTSELQSRLHLVCRLLLEKKKKKKMYLICMFQ